VTISPVVATCHDASAVDWAPLERFITAALSHGVHLDDGEFMWMGRCVLDNQTVVHLYKHVTTRRYLNLDAAGHTYGYRPPQADGAYETIHSPAVAVAEVLHHVSHGAARNGIAQWSSPAASSPVPPPGISP
jgi:hypothetical protein